MVSVYVNLNTPGAGGWRGAQEAAVFGLVESADRSALRERRRSDA